MLRQSERRAVYRERLAELSARGLTYPCFCTRGEIAAEIARMPSAPHGPEGPVYPGTCRALSSAERSSRVAAGEPHALRLDVEACVAAIGGMALQFEETGRGPAGESGCIAVAPRLFGDVVLGRKVVGVSYHLAVVVDDHEQGVTLVTRGEDLFAATHIQRLLQAVLGLSVPRYHHHALVRDAAGRRLAKRHRDLELKHLRATGATAQSVRAELPRCG